jgi:N-acetylneuraminic acid mutarotase
MGAAAVNGKLYAFGGTTEFPGPSVNGTYEYDPGNDSWTVRSAMPVALGVMGVGVVDGKIYCIGGLSNFSTTNVVLEYAPVEDRWTDLSAIAPMPTPRDHFVAATVNGKIHCIGGRQTTIESILDVHEVFDPATRSWSTAARLPTARGGSSAAVLNGRILIAGGEGANNSVGVFSENEEYDPVTDAWRSLSPMTTPRHSAQAGVIGDVVYVPGGALEIGRTFADVNEGFSFSFE